jgi:hypothetical protein
VHLKRESHLTYLAFIVFSIDSFDEGVSGCLLAYRPRLFEYVIVLDLALDSGSLVSVLLLSLFHGNSVLERGKALSGVCHSTLNLDVLL